MIYFTKLAIFSKIYIFSSLLFCTGAFPRPYGCLAGERVVIDEV